MTPLSEVRLESPQVTFWGAAQAVTGSMHLVEWAGERVLLDCGLMLGWYIEAQRRNRHFPFRPAGIAAVMLSHAHIDHCGNLPNLLRQGYSGPIYCTPATRDLLGIMLADSARIHEEEMRVAGIVGGVDEFSLDPLYSAREVRRTLEQCVPIPYDRPFEVCPGVTGRLVDAGHLLGSAMIWLGFGNPESRASLTFTGDLGRRGLGFLRPPAPIPEADLVICESTYGGRTHQPLRDLAAKLHDVVGVTIERGGKVLIPAFSLGRTQLVVHYLRHWMGQGSLPRAPIYVDSPLAAAISEVHDIHAECLASDAALPLAPYRTDRDPEATAVPIHYVRDVRESKELSRRRGSCILVASGGMCEAGRIVNHFEENLDDPRNAVLLVSYQAPGSLGRRLLERGPTVQFRGRRWNKWADIVYLDGFSGHADRADLLAFFEPLLEKSPRIELVHGEMDQAEALAADLRKRGFGAVNIPRRGDTVRVGRCPNVPHAQ